MSTTDVEHFDRESYLASKMSTHIIVSVSVNGEYDEIIYILCGENFGQFDILEQCILLNSVNSSISFVISNAMTSISYNFILNIDFQKMFRHKKKLVWSVNFDIWTMLEALCQWSNSLLAVIHINSSIQCVVIFIFCTAVGVSFMLWICIWIQHF